VLKITVFSYITPCRLVEVYHSGGNCCRHNKIRLFTLTRMMKAAGSSATSAHNQQRYRPEEGYLHIHCRDSLISYGSRVASTLHVRAASEYTRVLVFVTKGRVVAVDWSTSVVICNDLCYRVVGVGTQNLLLCPRQIPLWIFPEWWVQPPPPSPWEERNFPWAHVRHDINNFRKFTVTPLRVALMA
jgi:hypothetical protein